jgi:hypothetical protein
MPFWENALSKRLLDRDNIPCLLRKPDYKSENQTKHARGKMNSALLLVIEQLFVERRDDEAKERVLKLALPIVLKWERLSTLFRDGIARLGLWESMFSLAYSVTCERLKKSLGRRANASALVSQIRVAQEDDNKNVWRSLLVLILESDRLDRGTWQVGSGWQTACHPADEFGIDQVHFMQPANFRIKVIQFQREDMRTSTFDIRSPALVSLGMQNELIMQPVKIWTTPFQNAAIVQLQNVKTKKMDLVWIPNRVDRDFELSNWALNHNTMQESPQDFRSPPFLHGTDSDPAIIACTEGRTDVPNAKTALSTLVIRRQDVLFFDQLKQTQNNGKHWRQLLTNEFPEPRRIPVTSACYVLDAFLLYASNDGVIRAHPRGNPKSMYNVEELHTLIPHMTSLYNVVALIHSYCVLEVRRVEKSNDDPFLRFHLLYADQAADTSHPPVLYGPYVIYRALDGTWYRVLYDNHAGPVREQIKVPFKAGWDIVAIKNANWRYWSVALKNPQTGGVEEFLLFAGGLRVDGTTKPFLIASCVECGARATHLCKNCTNVGFCPTHAETHDHLEKCDFGHDDM